MWPVFGAGRSVTRMMGSESVEYGDRCWTLLRRAGQGSLGDFTADNESRLRGRGEITAMGDRMAIIVSVNDGRSA